VTALYVTHNRTTARELADRIAVMRDGRVVQVDDPATVFDRPATPFVARFTGSNCVPASSWAGAIEGEPADERDGRDRSADGVLAIRPEHVVLGEGGVTATVERVTDGAVGVRVALHRRGSVVETYVTDAPTVGRETSVRFPGEHVTWFGPTGEAT
jgi:ABC-type sugar transport system ATPase subunit